MSKAQDQLAQQLLNTWMASLNQANQPSQYETMLGGQATGVLDWAKKGDFSSAPTGVFFNMVDPAVRQRQRELTMGAGAQGSAASGGANPTALALDKQNRADEFAEDSAANYQQNVSNAIGSAAGVAGDLAGIDQSRRMGILNSTAGMAGKGVDYQFRQKTPWWKSALAGAAQALPAFV